jgi:hypothetical protein
VGLAHPEGVRAGNSVISAPRPLAADPLFERAEAASEAEAAPLLALGLGPAAAEFGGHFLDLSDAVGTPSRGFLFDLRLRARRRLLEALFSAAEHSFQSSSNAARASAIWRSSASSEGRGSTGSAQNGFKLEKLSSTARAFSSVRKGVSSKDRVRVFQ